MMEDKMKKSNFFRNIAIAAFLTASLFSCKNNIDEPEPSANTSGTCTPTITIALNVDSAVASTNKELFASIASRNINPMDINTSEFYTLTYKYHLCRVVN